MKHEIHESFDSFFADAMRSLETRMAKAHSLGLMVRATRHSTRKQMCLLQTCFGEAVANVSALSIKSSFFRQLKSTKGEFMDNDIHGARA